MLPFGPHVLTRSPVLTNGNPPLTHGKKTAGLRGRGGGVGGGKWNGSVMSGLTSEGARASITNRPQYTREEDAWVLLHALTHRARELAEGRHARPLAEGHDCKSRANREREREGARERECVCERERDALVLHLPRSSQPRPRSLPFARVKTHKGQRGRPRSGKTLKST